MGVLLSGSLYRGNGNQRSGNRGPGQLGACRAPHIHTYIYTYKHAKIHTYIGTNTYAQTDRQLVFSLKSCSISEYKNQIVHFSYFHLLCLSGSLWGWSDPKGPGCCCHCGHQSTWWPHATHQKREWTWKRGSDSNCSRLRYILNIQCWDKIPIIFFWINGYQLYI